MSFGSLKKAERRKNKFFLFVKLLLAIALLAAIGGGFMLYERELPQISILTDLDLIGPDMELNLLLADKKSGIQRVDAVFVQNGREKILLHATFPRSGYFPPPGPHQVEKTLTISPDQLGLKDGAAELIITVRDFSFWAWLQGNESSKKIAVTIDTQPPVVRIMDSPRTINAGGSGVVVYQLAEAVKEHGVSINGMFHPGFPLPNRGESSYGALVGIPYDTEKLEEMFVVATDAAGNQGRAKFGMILKTKPLKRDRINISQSFLDLKLPEFANFYPGLRGSSIEQYIQVNNQVRDENNGRIQEACAISRPERMWDGSFKRMSRSSRRASFADHRSYFFEGNKIDEQVHLGIDLASVRHAEVTAANNGVVVFADYLGIYGNMIIIDHGLGVFSLYSHLSQMQAAVGDTVNSDDLIGLTGTSGMAGGDHLHFSILINGIFVNPLEWWDAHWLKVNILSYL